MPLARPEIRAESSGVRSRKSMSHLRNREEQLNGRLLQYFRGPVTFLGLLNKTTTDLMV